LIGYDKRKLNNALVANKNQDIPEKQAFSLPNQVKKWTDYHNFRFLLKSYILFEKKARYFVFRAHCVGRCAIVYQRKKNNICEKQLASTSHFVCLACH
jgi:hypothetical protein